MKIGNGRSGHRPVYSGFSPTDLSGPHSWMQVWYAVGTLLAFIMASVCIAYQWHSATGFPSRFSHLIASYNGPLLVAAVTSVWTSCCRVQNAVLVVSWACGWVLLLAWQPKCLLLLNLIFWASTQTRAVSWLVRVWLQPSEGPENDDAGACRMQVHGEAQEAPEYSSENINVIQRWGLLLIESLCFPWLGLLSSWGASSTMVVVTGGSQGHLSGQPVWSIQRVSLCGQSMKCSGS